MFAKKLEKVLPLGGNLAPIINFENRDIGREAHVFLGPVSHGVIYVPVFVFSYLAESSIQYKHIIVLFFPGLFFMIKVLIKEKIRNFIQLT